MMGSGKSTVARALAKELGWPLIDNDAQIAASTGQAAPRLFHDAGETALHDAERAAFLEAVDAPTPSIVTAAGFVVDEADLRDRLAKAGLVVWLRARPETLRRRIAGGGGRRSDAVDVDWLLANAERRAPLYASVADTIVDVDERPVDDIVRAVIDVLDQPGSA
jgi:shikimate kinase